MVRVIVPVAVLLVLASNLADCARAADIVCPNAIPICSIIIREMSDGSVSPDKAEEIALAIANAANRHFGRVTCGDMWLYMAIAYVESGFRSHIINSQNCRGIFQIHAPSWARKFGVRYSDLLNIEVNADCGIRVYKYYLGLYKKVIPALSAYNSDHPRAAMNYAWAVLSTRRRIKRRYVALYRAFKEETRMAAKSPTPELPQTVAGNPVASLPSAK
jgi:Transglycosylase SLT domain